MNRKKYKDETFNQLPSIIECSNFTNCIFNAPTKFIKCNLEGCTFNSNSRAEFSNLIGCNNNERVETYKCGYVSKEEYEEMLREELEEEQAKQIQQEQPHEEVVQEGVIE